MRINRFLSDSGVCSRREADRFIEEARVRVNGRVAVLGENVGEGDVVMLDGKQIQLSPPKVYLMYNKPIGITCTTDRKIKGNIVDAVGHKLRVFPVGRLDKDSSGLIFLTNDGSVVNRILRSHYGHEKEYRVKVDKAYSSEFLPHMQKGVSIDGYVTKPCQVKACDRLTFNIVLTEGKNRQIRRMCEALGYKVLALHRFRIMNVLLGELPTGRWQDIPQADLKKLFGQLEKEKPAYQKNEAENDSGLNDIYDE